MDIKGIKLQGSKNIKSTTNEENATTNSIPVRAQPEGLRGGV